METDEEMYQHELKWICILFLCIWIIFWQAILASAFARQDHSKAAATASRILQLGLVLGLLLSIFLGIGLRLGSRLFTDDQDVLHHIYLGIPVNFLYTDAKIITILSHIVVRIPQLCAGAWCSFMISFLLCIGMPAYCQSYLEFF